MPAARRARPRPKTADASVPAGRRARNKEATRRRIVTAALQLFEAKGFDATTTKAIAKRARVAEGTVFNYFETKDDIALHFFELEVDHAIHAVRARTALRRAPLEEKLFALIQYQIDFLAPHEQFIGAAFVQALRPSSTLAFGAKALALRTRYLAFVQELIDESLAAPPSPPSRGKGTRKAATPPAGQGDAFLSWIAPHAFWIYYLGVLLYWLHDRSPGKRNTLAFLDRSLRLGVAVLRNGAI